MLSALNPSNKYFFTLLKHWHQCLEKLSDKLEKIVLQ